MKPVKNEQLLAVFQDTLRLIAPLLPQASSKYQGLLSNSFAAKHPNTRIDIKNTDCLDECLFLRQQARGTACRIGLVSPIYRISWMAAVCTYRYWDWPYQLTMHG